MLTSITLDLHFLILYIPSGVNLILFSCKEKYTYNLILVI